MLSPIVQPPQQHAARGSETQQAPGQGRPMDPLSQVLALLKPQSLSSGGFRMPGDMAIWFPKHQGIKCYAVLTGRCWLTVDGLPEPVQLNAGDCFLLPRGLPFRLATDLSLQPIFYADAWGRLSAMTTVPDESDGGGLYLAGGFFSFTGSHADLLLQSLPPIVHLRRESEKAAMRWALERMREELRDPQPGSSLIAQQLAYTMLIQALRLHLSGIGNTSGGWLSALSDTQMSLAITSMHNDPGAAWTLQSLADRVGMSRSVFAERFRETVGATPMEYLTRWRMLLAADRLKNSSDGMSGIAQSLGYDSDSAFGKAFRRVMGCSPGQHRRAVPATAVPSGDRTQHPA